jgi:PIN domain nuclease of toxin-antitoxin system
MRGLLLDTHIWLWYAEGVSERLPPSSVKLLDQARRKDGLLVSAISVWEIGAQSAKGRIQLSIPRRDSVAKALDVPGIHLTPLDAITAAESTLPPGRVHGDPADRFLIATARTHGVALATRDEKILEYGKLGFPRVVES